LDFGQLREELAAAIDDAYTKQAERFLTEIEREVGERVKLIEDVRGRRLSHLLFTISNTRTAAFDQRTHRRFEIMVPRFPWVHLAAIQIKSMERDTLREEILQYWKLSLDQLESLRGGPAPFNDLLRELMLSIVTNQWVDYLTAIEALREGIGLQAFGQRNPLVEYQSRAYAMFQDLYARIRSQVVTNVFTYQYRGFARLESEDRDRASRRAIETPAASGGQAALPAGQSVQAAAPSAPASGQNGAAGKPEPVQASSGNKAAKGHKPEPARKPIGAPVGTKLGRNDPCWCGSGKKYKNCHMQSDMK
jgi:preprotein translocase subunit SecA